MSEDKGIRCGNCGCRDLPVKRTEARPGGKLRRQRVCRHCGRVVFTYEVTAATQMQNSALLSELSPEKRQNLFEKLLALLGMN